MRARTVGFLAALTVVAATTLPAQAEPVTTTSDPRASVGGAFVTYVGCQSFFGATSAPGTRLNLGPATAPMGRRSLGLVPTRAGTASGPFVPFTSLAATSAGVSVHAAGGTRGVSYVWVTTPDAPAGTAWSGRADIGVGAGAWQRVDAARTTYTWSLVDLASRRRVADGGRATPAAFAARHGDGAGYVVTGFGCGGEGFNIDAVRGAGATLDFEGLSLTTGIAAPGAAGAGRTVTISGTVRNGAQVTGDPLVLQARPAGGTWQDVGGLRLAGPDGTTRAEVVLEATTAYRWYRPQSEYADEGWSAEVTVRALQAATAEPQPPSERPTPTSKPTSKPTAKPSSKPTAKSSSKPAATPSSTPTSSPSTTSSTSPSASPSATPSGQSGQ